jgi:hypothetical protein
LFNTRAYNKIFLWIILHSQSAKHF